MYKRQSQSYMARQEAAFAAEPEAEYTEDGYPEDGYAQGAVSYTHLDVYKRQA